MNWQEYKPGSNEPWNLQRAWTLHRRFGFAATWSELQRDLADGWQKSIDRVVAGKSATFGVPENMEQMSKVIGSSAVSSNRNERLTAWWIYRMYLSPNPLRERMAIMWHNHFATSNAKVKDLNLMHQQNQVFRQHGLGKFNSLLEKILKHGAMLKWLDGDENRAGQINENLGRETLELFTLGAGNYTEDDVKNASRALTGWSVHQAGFRIREDWHDADSKTILGQSGNFSGDDLIEIACAHPATAKRIAWRLCSEFLCESLVTDENIDSLAAILSNSELNISAAVETILRSQLFFSDANLKRQIIAPEPFVVGAVRALELFDPPASTMVLSDWIEQLGRKLFYPPNVGGWPGGRSWLNSRTTIARANFGVTLTQGRLNKTGSKPDLLKLAEQHIGNQNLPEVVEFYSQLLTGTTNEQLNRTLLEKARTAAKNAGSDNDSDVAGLAVALILSSPAAQLS